MTSWTWSWPTSADSWVAVIAEPRLRSFSAFIISSAIARTTGSGLLPSTMKKIFPPAEPRSEWLASSTNGSTIASAGSTHSSVSVVGIARSKGCSGEQEPSVQHTFLPNQYFLVFSRP